MNNTIMARTDNRSLFHRTLSGGTAQRFLADDVRRLPLAGLEAQTYVADIEQLRGKSVFLAMQRQFLTALALLELDGVARRVFLATPDLPTETVKAASPDVVMTDAVGWRDGTRYETRRDVKTEWILFTSGTTGQPKMVVHTLASLAGVLGDGLNVATGAVWSAFYDIRRYGGLQILLRALLGGGSIVLQGVNEPYGFFIRRCIDEKVTHISGTPSHWRQALICPEIVEFKPQYVRAGGEIVEQPMLDQLVAAFPAAQVMHAYASTEAGVGFDVRDGKAGFPAAIIDQPPDDPNKPQLYVQDGTLWVRSNRTASAYLNEQWPWPDGLIDTGDRVERQGDRYYFLGRREGVINVGGRKVYPEEVEAILNEHPSVRTARAWARPNAVTGQVVAADLVLDVGQTLDDVGPAILHYCRAALPAWKVPVTLRQVDSIPINPAGKIVRTGV
jgi:acyl-CoA synthetase (AMP-forming)/AMP-acid ligase II